MKKRTNDASFYTILKKERLQPGKQFTAQRFQTNMGVVYLDVESKNSLTF